jgi:hypothetical protein
MQMQSCGEPPADIVDDMSRAIAADIPTLTGRGAGAAAGGAGGLQGPDAAAAGESMRMDALLADLLGSGGQGGEGPELGDLLGDLPGDLKGCPVQ